MGAETLIHGVEGRHDLRVVVDRSRRVSVGQRLHLRPRPGRVHLFDETGNEDQRMTEPTLAPIRRHVGGDRLAGRDEHHPAVRRSRSS